MCYCSDAFVQLDGMVAVVMVMVMVVFFLSFRGRFYDASVIGLNGAIHSIQRAVARIGYLKLLKLSHANRRPKKIVSINLFIQWEYVVFGMVEMEMVFVQQKFFKWLVGVYVFVQHQPPAKIVRYVLCE